MIIEKCLNKRKTYIHILLPFLWIHKVRLFPETIAALAMSWKNLGTPGLGHQVGHHCKLNKEEVNGEIQTH